MTGCKISVQVPDKDVVPEDCCLVHAAVALESGGLSASQCSLSGGGLIALGAQPLNANGCSFENIRCQSGEQGVCFTLSCKPKVAWKGARACLCCMCCLIHNHPQHRYLAVCLAWAKREVRHYQLKLAVASCRMCSAATRLQCRPC